MVEKITLPIASESVRGATPARRESASRPPDSGRPDFAAVLRQEMEEEGLRFSRHATSRLQARGIELDAAQRDRIERAVEAARQKGAKESLILLDDLAFVVSVRNRTVITAIDAAHRRSNVFTHIDSAVLA